MNNSIFKCVMVGCILLGAANSFSQCKEADYGTDRAKAEACNAIYSDALTAGKYAAARGPLVWLLNNAPKIGSIIYVNAATIYDNLASAEKDPAKKQVLVDSMLLMYDLRIKSCGE